LQNGASSHAAGSDSNGHGSAEGQRMVAKVLEERGFVSVRPEQITKLVGETGALARASNLARDYVCRAKACLEELPDTEYRRALLAVPDFILERQN
jgi:octaprenyl-diphosphate synthase